MKAQTELITKRLDGKIAVITGRKSGRDIPRPVWFVHEHNTLYLLPNYGSDTELKI
jgi:hypothetical protein